MSSSVVQSILFPVSLYTTRQAQAWMRKHGFKPIKRHTTKDFYRYRLFPPEIFSRFRTKKLDNGIEFIFGFF